MPNDAEVSPSSPQKRLRVRYVVALIAAALASPIVVWLVWGWIEAARLDRALDALEAGKEPLDIAEFDAKPKTPEQREASHVYAAAYKAVGDRMITPSQMTALARSIEDLCSPSADAATKAANIQALRAFEEPYVAAFALLDRATALDAAGWDDVDRLRRASVEEMRPIYLMRANAVRIASLACTGEGTAAANALLATLRLRRVDTLLMAFPFQTPHSLHSLLTFGGASPASLAAIQSEYAWAAAERIFEQRLLRQRAFWLSSMLPGVFSDPPEHGGSARITPLEGIVRRLVQPLRNHRIVSDLHEFEAAIAVARQPWPGKLDAVRAFAGNHRRGVGSGRPNMIDALTRPFGAHVASNTMAGYLDAAAETLARARASVGAVAVARYRADHAGAMPASLQNLIPGYLDAPLIDPYNGAELTYRVEGAAYKVYSVGINRKDDGGSWEEHSDLQSFRRGNPLDVGIAVIPSPAASRH